MDATTPCYLVRYGRAGHVGRFGAAPGPGAMGRGDAVVVRTARGLELGEVLVATRRGDAANDLDAGDAGRIVRPAAPADLEAARVADSTTPDLLTACDDVLACGLWPVEVLDAEPLLDDDRVVLHYLGPHRFGSDVLAAALRDRLGRDVLLEPVGPDAATGRGAAAARRGLRIIRRRLRFGWLRLRGWLRLGGRLPRRRLSRTAGLAGEK